MTQKIAIIDFFNHDLGIKLLFPESDLYILKEHANRDGIYRKYNISHFLHQKDGDIFDKINQKKYDFLFVIAPLYDGFPFYDKTVLHSNTPNKETNTNIATEEFLNNTIDLILSNQFQKVCFFDNYDFDYDPNNIISSGRINEDTIKEKNIFFFKRNYNKQISYNVNVFPFPYIIFGQENNIDMINDLFEKQPVISEKQNRVFFCGNVFGDENKNIPECNKSLYGCVRNRINIYTKLRNKISIFNPGCMYHSDYMNEMAKSKYCLDLLGAGDPNIRTFEIFSCKSLRISQRSNITWNFDDDFREETYFENEDEFYEKIIQLEKNEELYKKCLDKQNEIVSKYMNTQFLRKYILDSIL
jgi:hypothetical protein